jgi:hypothetical protein
MKATKNTIANLIANGITTFTRLTETNGSTSRGYYHVVKTYIIKFPDGVCWKYRTSGNRYIDAEKLIFGGIKEEAPVICWP